MPALRWTGIPDAGRMTLILKRKLVTHDWLFRVSMSLLGICIVDSWLLFTGAEGNRRHKSCAEFAERTKQRTYVLDAGMLMEVLHGFATRRLAGIALYSTYETYVIEYWQYKVQRRNARRGYLHAK